MLEVRQHVARPVSERSLRSHQAITLSLLFAAGLINFLDRSSLSVANNTIRAEMHLSGTQIGWLLTAFSLAYGFAQLPLIELLDRAGTRSTLGVGLVLWSTAQLVTGSVRGFPTFVACRVLLGAGEAPFYPAGIRSIRDWFSAEGRGRATAMMNTSQTIGLALAPPALTWLMLRLGWRTTFAALGGCGLVVAVAWLVLHRSREATTWRNEPRMVDRKGTLRFLLRQRTVWGMMLGFGGVNYTSWLYISWLPGYLQTGRHLSLATSGWVAALPFLVGALGMVASGTLADRLARAGHSLATVHRVNIIAGMTLSAAATFLVAHASSTTQAVVGISFALFCIHFAGTSGWGYVQTISPAPMVASLGALQNFASFLIASAAPVVTGWLLDRTHSFTIALGVCSAVTLLGALCYATLAAPEGFNTSGGVEILSADLR